MYEIKIQLFQPWSTFVMKTHLPPSILEKMIRITDEIVEDRVGKGDNPGAGQIEDQFNIDLKILEQKQEELLKFFLQVCKTYIVQAYCQSEPHDREMWIKKEWFVRMTGMWINSQKDNEYFPLHDHKNCALSAILLLKIPEYLPPRKSADRLVDQPDRVIEDGSIVFLNNVAKDDIWGKELTLQPKVGDFFIFPASQKHLVYPFRTPDGKGERRSVSFNVEFSSKTEQEAKNPKNKKVGDKND